jgi:hypothetical protein
LGEYYSERDARTPVWLLAGDTHTVATLVGLTDIQRAGGDADAGLVARWLDEGISPNGAHGRAFGQRGVHGFDLTFCAPKSVSLVRALRTDHVVAKAIANAHTTALSEAMEYLAAHAGYTRVHNPHTGEKDLLRLPGLVAVAYQHETSRCGDPHLHTHVIVPNRQARAGGRLVSIDGTSLYHEARAAGVIYQATLRRELNRAGAGVGSGGSVHGDGRGRRRPCGDDSGVVAALEPAARVGGRQSGPRRRRATDAGPVGDRAESHPAQETRRAGVGPAAAQLARGRARAAVRPRRARRRTSGAHRRIARAV